MKTDIELLYSLLRIPSVSSDHAQVNRAMSTMRDYLSAHGLHCTMERCGDLDVLHAATTPGKVHDYLFNAHLDVVPAPAQLFEPKAEGGRIFARGTHDCKGNAVAIAQALAALAGKASAAAVFTADEEVGGDTTAFAVGRGYSARRMAVVLDSEPYAITIAQKGIADFLLKASGTSVHSSKPWLGDNAIDRLLDGYARIRAAWPKNAPGADGDIWFDTFSATIVNGGTAHNKVPDEASLLLNIRFTRPGGQNAIAEWLRGTSGLDAECVSLCHPFSCDEGDPAFAGLRRAMSATWPGRDIPFKKMTGATDARHLIPLGVPIAIIGIDGDDDHTDGEWLRADSVGETAGMLVDFLSENARQGSGGA